MISEQHTPFVDATSPAGRLLTAARTVCEADLEGMSQAALVGEMAVIEQARRKVEARQYQLAAALREQRADRLREQGVERERAGQRAERETRNTLVDELQWGPSDAKRASRIGRELPGDSEAGRRLSDGSLSPRHAKLLADTLIHLVGEERELAQIELLAAADREDPVAFGRTCRRLLARLDHDAAMSDQQRRHGRRRAAASLTDDGMLALSASLAGVDAETYATALDAFRRADVAGEPRRSGEQATADAMVEMAAAALRAGQAPAAHGVRPQVTVEIDYPTLLTGAGVAETVWSGPLPFGEVRRLLADAGVARLLLDGDGLPVETGPATRTVPAGVWRALVRRDRGCIAVGCDAPASWCDVMHLEESYRFGGRLSLANAALGCRTHHRRYDLHDWEVTRRSGRPVLHPPGRPPDPRPEQGPGLGHDPDLGDSGAGPDLDPSSGPDHGPGPGVGPDPGVRSGPVVSGHRGTTRPSSCGHDPPTPRLFDIEQEREP